jgi:CDP-glucose 4,6-dehydratase
MPPTCLQMLRDTYQSRRIFITGHTGFKGAWLALWLVQLGAEVTGYALEPPTTPNLFESIGLREQLTHIHGDVRDYDRLFAAIQSQAPDLVFHLAAQSLVRLSYQEPRLTYETNVMGTVNVLEAVRHTPSVRVAVNVTSDKCYENREPVLGCREEDPMGGSDPYSSSKGCSELVTAAFLRSFFAPGSYGKTHRVALASVRAGNVIGGGDWGADRLVPDCVRALSRREEIVLRYPAAVRPWQHVLDPLSGYLLLGAKLWQDGPRYAGAWNFGPDEKVTWTVEEVVREIIRQWGEGRCRVDGSAHPHEAQLLKLDCRKAKMCLGWRPQYTVQEALSLGIDWYQRFYNQAAAAELHRFTVGQIERYQAASALADEMDSQRREFPENNHHDKHL